MTAKYTILYLVRHGESVWNMKGLTQGQLQHHENTLTQTGEQQAQRLADTLRDTRFDALYSSDLLRAKRTAEIIGLEKDLIVKTAEALREKSHGEFEGKKSEEYLKLFTKWANLSDHERLDYKITRTVETPNQALSRFILFLREVSLAHQGQIILIVTHGGIMRDFLVKLGIKTYDEFKGFQNTGYIKLRCDGVDFFVDEVQGVK